jgi:hypothetical protein
VLPCRLEKIARLALKRVATPNLLLVQSVVAPGRTRCWPASFTTLRGSDFARINLMSWRPLLACRRCKAWPIAIRETKATWRKPHKSYSWQAQEICRYRDDPKHEQASSTRPHVICEADHRF